MFKEVFRVIYDIIIIYFFLQFFFRFVRLSGFETYWFVPFFSFFAEGRREKSRALLDERMKLILIEILWLSSFRVVLVTNSYAKMRASVSVKYCLLFFFRLTFKYFRMVEHILVLTHISLWPVVSSTTFYGGPMSSPIISICCCLLLLW